MKKKIYYSCNIILAILFVISILLLNVKSIFFLMICIFTLYVFKKNYNKMFKISNKVMLILLGIIEILLLVTVLTNKQNLDMISIFNIIFLIFSLLIIFSIFKKGTNHCVATFSLVIYIILFFLYFINNLNCPFLMLISLAPFIDYTLFKVREKKITIKIFYLMLIMIAISYSIIFILLESKKLIVLNVSNLNILIITISYYFYIKALCKLLSHSTKYTIFNKQHLKKYVRAKTIRKVTAVIPNYNYAHYLHDRILSIVNQTYPIYELIILDDCSKDNSIEVIKKEMEWLKKSYPSLIVKFIPNKTNSGNVFKQWQKAFELSSGNYLWICEADDLCSKYFLNSVMKGFDDKKVILSYSESKAINENGKVFKKNLRDWIDIFNTGHWNNDYIEDGNHELKYFLSTNNTIANVSGVVFKKDTKVNFSKFLKEAQKFILAGDWYFYSKVLLNKKISYVSDSLNYHRIHSGSVTSTTDNFVHYKEIISIQNSISNDVKIPKEMLKRIEERNSSLRRNLCISDDELYYDKIDLKRLIKEKNIEDDVLLSIIIPVYNVEKYLTKCLKSVFKNLPIRTEVIIINDGSPDNSESIIESFANNHDEIIYIKKENGGLSSVKNVGLKAAKGKYVIFLDSDDYVSNNMYETMLKKIIDTDSDIVYCDVLMTFEDNSVRYVTMKNYVHTDELMQILDNNLMAASWNKIVKKELYNNLNFPEGMNNEDVAVSPQLFLRANKIGYIPSPFYKYVQRNGSIQNSGFSEKRFVIFDTASICFNSIKNYGYIEQEKVIGAIVTHQILAILIYLIMPIKDKILKRKYIEIFCKKFNELDIDISNNYYVYEYLYQHNMVQLITYIKNCDINSIERIR